MQIKNLLNYFKSLLLENKKYIKLAAILALASLLAGIAVFYYNPGILRYILEIFAEKFGTVKRMDWKMVGMIFQANVIASLAAIVGGIALGLVPFMVIAFNFFAIGVVSSFFLSVVPINFALKILLLLASLMPHGILELPALLVSCALGFRLGFRWMLPENKGKRGQILKYDLILAIKTAPFLIVALFLAAIIEVFGSARFLEWITQRFTP